MKKKIVIFTVIIGLMLNLVSFSFATVDQTASNLNAYMSAMEKNRNFQGSVRVEKNGKVLLEKAYGMANVQKKIKNTVKTTFPIGSDTKQFTAVAIMQLQEKGLLNVSDKLSKYIPDYPRGKDITLYNLLTHTSGIQNFPAASDYSAINMSKVKIEDLIKLFESKPLDFEPGTKWSYSNPGYILLGYIVEKVSKMSLERYLGKYIFKPLKMNNTGVCYQNGKKMYTAESYVGYLEVQPVNEEQLLKVAFGAGYLYSTVGDLSLWANALTSGKLVKKKTLDQIFTPHEYMGNLTDYGYGWMIAGTDKDKEVYHGGNTEGCSSMIDLDLKNNIKIFILTNKGVVDVETLRKSLRSIALGKKIALPAKQKEISLMAADSDKYVGTYEITPGFNIVISKTANQFYAQITGQAKLPIFPESDTRFFFKLVDAEIVFTKNSDNSIDSLVIEQNGSKTTAKKVSSETQRKEADVDPAIFEKYVGDYQLAPGFIITVTSEDGKIFAQATGQQKFEIFPESETKYFCKIIDAEIEFVKDDSGTAKGLVLYQAGQQLKADKTK